MQSKLLILSAFFSILTSSIFSPPTINAVQGISRAENQNAMIRDLDAARNILKIKYAPIDWKKETVNYDLDIAFEIARTRVLTEDIKTDTAYQKIFKQFIKATQDYHVSPLFYSTGMAFFPLWIKGVDGRYFITSLEGSLELSLTDMLFLDFMDEEETEADGVEDINDEEKIEKDFELDKKVLDVKVGDEVIAINGVPVNTVIENLIDEELNGDRSPTGYAIAERTLFKRRGVYGHEVPQGTFEITILMQGKDSPESITLPWFTSSEWVDEFALNNSEYEPLIAKTTRNNQRNPSVAEAKTTITKYLTRDFSVPFAKDLLEDVDLRTLLKQKKSSKLKLNNANDSDKKIENDTKEESENEESENEEDDEDVVDDFRTKGLLPPIGKILWESDPEKQIYAYLAENDEGKFIGYIYIPTFDQSDKMAENLIAELVDTVNFFNVETEALVVDITNNPGGSLFYMYAVLSTLADKPLRVPTHIEKLIQEDVHSSAVLIKFLDFMENMKEVFKDTPENETAEETIPEESTNDGYQTPPSFFQQVKDYAMRTINTWKSGKTKTEPGYMFGIEEIVPHTKGHYTKPIVVLINELDFSCGDFFPAILQDNGRAILFGKRTAGAGGHVILNPLTSQFGVQGISITKSLAYRVNGMPIESLGVSPDVPCEITIRDLQENYIDYIKNLNTTVDSIIERNRGDDRSSDYRPW